MTMTEPFMGEVRIWALNFPPRDWAFCNGALMSIAQNTALFSLIGNTYGGDGRNTFALPNLQGRAPMGVGNGAGLTPRLYGARGGSETVVLNESNMPSHRHTVNAHVNDDQTQPGRGYIADAIFGPSSNAQMAEESIGLTGGGVPLNMMQPYLSLNFCIATYGIFPPRS
jgi:microcystin-dependent protein